MRDDNALAMVTAAEKGFAAAGARGLLEATLQIQKKLYAQHSLSSMGLAQTFGLLGNKDEALRYLKIAYDDGTAPCCLCKSTRNSTACTANLHAAICSRG